MSFDRAIAFVLEAEGGYVNDPEDPGGETKYGISKRAYPDLDIASLTKEAAASIYRQDYWYACRCQDLPASLALMVLDSAVNRGPGNAVRLLQAAVGAQVDGKVGPETIRLAQAAVASPEAQREALLRLAVNRALDYFGIGKFPRFGRGWIRRTFECYRAALELAEESEQ